MNAKRSQLAGAITPSAPPPDPAPPKGLSAAARKLWTDTVQRFDFRPSELALVEAGLRSWDRAEKARAAVERDGLTVVTATTGAVRAHPSIGGTDRSLGTSYDFAEGRCHSCS